MKSPRIRFYQPVNSLRAYIASYSFADIDGGDPVHALLLPAWANIRLVLSGHRIARLGHIEDSSKDKPTPLFA
jgi:hypothetical protein